MENWSTRHAIQSDNKTTNYRLIIAILSEVIPNWITVVAPFNEQQPDALAQTLVRMAVQQVFLSIRDMFLHLLCPVVQKSYIYGRWEHASHLAQMDEVVGD